MKKRITIVFNYPESCDDFCSDMVNVSFSPDKLSEEEICEKVQQVIDNSQASDRLTEFDEACEALTNMGCDVEHVDSSDVFTFNIT